MAQPSSPSTTAYAGYQVFAFIAIKTKDHEKFAKSSTNTRSSPLFLETNTFGKMSASPPSSFTPLPREIDALAQSLFHPSLFGTFLQNSTLLHNLPEQTFSKELPSQRVSAELFVPCVSLTRTG
jgi:hypothetical protein